ncbi:hypothetical protein [Harryflintia acetispora]|uniref:Uncharacterized protein n=1 Tax=Harryflintia acetispora TaxID=1849041 RepID=A0A9X8Y857_9FIRM|nr:hypothetical protein [Harryflintia acetispora]TCL43308.1 hypothetical protein EDD78_106171 [Harryflintia acetispora]
MKNVGFCVRLLLLWLALPTAAAGAQAVAYQSVRGIEVEFTPSPRTGRYRFEVYEAGSQEAVCSKSFDSLTGEQKVFLPVECLPEKTYTIKVTALPEPGREGLDVAASKEQAFISQPVCGHTAAEGGFLYGSGTADDPFIVSTPQQFDHVRQHNGGSFLQTRDLDFSSFGIFSPIWPNEDSAGSESHVGGFSGIYDGGGYIIQNIVVGNAEHYWRNGQADGRYGYPASLFVAKDMTLRNLGMDASCKIEGSRAYAASFVCGSRGTASLTIERCYSEADINLPAMTYSFSGGIFAGFGNNMTIRDCYFSGRITGINQTAGISSQTTSGSIACCYNIGSCTNDNVPEADGIQGYTGNVVSSCYSISNWPTRKGSNLGQDEFALQSSFAGWDFDSVWTMGSVTRLDLSGARQTMAAPVLRVFEQRDAAAVRAADYTGQLSLGN